MVVTCDTKTLVGNESELGLSTPAARNSREEAIPESRSETVTTDCETSFGPEPRPSSRRDREAVAVLNTRDPQPNENAGDAGQSEHRSFRVIGDKVPLTSGEPSPASCLKWMAAASCVAFPPLGVMVALLVWRMHRRQEILLEEVDSDIKAGIY